ncbi:peptidoglycan-binding protein [Bradyrhizobium sp. GCM10027634]|uniref:peptidoglycan-binding protein n=1 Tax=unclassified Bradyrhizobium TaxID=2631580 RepID=UPI00188B06CE|nr:MULTISPECIES: peptidoglycan-binding protein [unclassified Bradyrhizobium]MDN5000593.1 peptidoglycan-binding protein [Bradyrhizobium sp. WYCCWR 12677]QOZ42674.1 hypothetical protein XH89_03710 [Bradyrhizobium sp. CCBAU 53340]
MVSYESLKSEYEKNWANLQIRPSRLGEANATARKAINGKATYQQVEQLTGVPWPFVALCHYRESNFDFDTYLGNGEPLRRATCLVPKGRGPFASFVDGAVDALRIQNFVGAQDWCIARMLYRLECFNGLGYHAKGVNSPYLYGGSTLYGPTEARGGKFVADHVFDPNHVDTQLGTAVILHAMMALDSSVTIGDSPSIVPRSEPDEDAAASVLLMQQTLNKLGANPPLDEDGISGPKTKAAVSAFQQRNGLPDTGLLDGTTIAAITRAGVQPIQTPNVDLSQILMRLESLAQLLQGAGASQAGVPSGGAASGGATTVSNDPINLLEQLLSLVNKTTPMPGPATPTGPATPVDQLKPVLDLLGVLLNKDSKPVLGQVNGALGETIGKMLDGKKTALGIAGSLITALLSAVTASPNAGGLAGLFGTIASAVPGLSQFALPISLALTAWGVLGKLEKWAQGTAPPPKPTT